MPVEGDKVAFLDKACNRFSKIVFTNDVDPYPKNTVKGFLRNDFNFTITSRYQSAFDQGALGDISGAVNAGTSVANGALGTNIQNMQGKCLDLTVANWLGTDKPTFSITMLFVSYKPEINVINEVKKLMKGVLPFKGMGNWSLNAPLKYAPKGAAGASGCWTVRIGNWFVGPFMIMTSVAPTYSKEVVKDGQPLYADVAVTFEPYRLIDAKEFLSCFYQENLNSWSEMKFVDPYSDVGLGGRLLGGHSDRGWGLGEA